MLKVFYTKVSDLPASAEGLPISDYRIKKLEKITHPEKRRQSIAAELLLNHAVTSFFPDAEIPCEIHTNEYGKPALKNLPACFSLSHSGDIVVCAISDNEIGIDVEYACGYKAAVVERFFTSHEKLLLDDKEDRDYGFGRIWTAKESALKYLGIGLNRSLASVSLQNNNEVLLVPENKALNLSHRYVSETHISVCTERKENFELEYVVLRK